MTKYNFIFGRTRLALALLGSLFAAPFGYSQLAFGVDSLGNLFRLNLAAPASTTTVGNIGFVPDAIDFRTGTNTLYAINVGASSAQLFTIDTTSGAASGIGSGFALSGMVGGVGYDLTTASSFGFDFNPATLQPDGSIRIRLTSDNGVNLRLNSATGGIAAVDGSLSGTIGAVAYINNAVASIGGTTALYDIDYATDSFLVQNPPNAGTLFSIGALGVDVGPIIGFDILSDPDSSDVSFGGDSAYLVNTLAAGSSMLYSVNIGTGAASALSAINRDFTGGFAIASPVPEPAHFGLGAGAILLGLTLYRRRRLATVKNRPLPA